MLLSTHVDIRITARMNGALPLVMAPEERLVEQLIWDIGPVELRMDSRMARSRQRRQGVPCPSLRRCAWRRCAISMIHIGRISGLPKVFATRITCEPAGGAAT